MTFHVPEQFRCLVGPLQSRYSDGNNGLFLCPHFGVMLFCICSDGADWEHVSVTIKDRKLTKQIMRCPTWQEMCYVKQLFWDDTDAVIQVHPAAKDYVDYHPYCLHLWRPIGRELVLPPKELVGVFNGLEKDTT
jgi:hypothetical protein